MTAQNKFYRPESEKDTQNGYADLFLLPMTEIYKDMKNCYIIELKYAKGKDSDEVVSRLRRVRESRFLLLLNDVAICSESLLIEFERIIK